MWLLPGIQDAPVTAYNTGRERDDDNQTGLQTMVAPLHSLAATTSGSVRPFAGNKPVYARTDVIKSKKEKDTRKGLKHENPTLPIGMGSSFPPLYNNGDPLLQRPDNKGFGNKTEWTRAYLNTVSEGMFAGTAGRLKSLLTRTPPVTTSQTSNIQDPELKDVNKADVAPRKKPISIRHSLGSVTPKPASDSETTILPQPEYSKSDEKWIRRGINTLAPTRGRQSGKGQVEFGLLGDPETPKNAPMVSASNLKPPIKVKPKMRAQLKSLRPQKQILPATKGLIQSRPPLGLE